MDSLGNGASKFDTWFLQVAQKERVASTQQRWILIWARKFGRFLKPKHFREASPEDVRRFLIHIAKEKAYPWKVEQAQKAI